MRHWLLAMLLRGLVSLVIFAVFIALLVAVVAVTTEGDPSDDYPDWFYVAIILVPVSAPLLLTGAALGWLSSWHRSRSD
jgi:Zn-dependent protease with chaperone function